MIDRGLTMPWTYTSTAVFRLDTELIDASRRGNELYSIDSIIPGRTLKILKYKDASTSQPYISFVPNYMEKADEAMAWKFSLSGNEYGMLGGEA